MGNSGQWTGKSSRCGQRKVKHWAGMAKNTMPAPDKKEGGFFDLSTNCYTLVMVSVVAGAGIGNKEYPTIPAAAILYGYWFPGL